MKQIIPFKKELLFKTKLSEITSISLEHTLSLKDDDLISGEFYISGDYKMTEGSINREKFDFKLPFDITLDSRYNIDSIVIDIDNFYYEIINNESLQVNIDVYIEGEKYKEIELIKEDKEEILDKSIKEVETIEVVSNNEDNACDRIKKDDYYENDEDNFDPGIEISKPQTIIMDSIKEDTNNVKKQEINLFENIDNSDTYVTYYVYIVKEEDTLDKILTKYNVTKDEVGHYNNLDNIIPGTKLIIPSNNNE